MSSGPLADPAGRERTALTASSSIYGATGNFLGYKEALVSQRPWGYNVRTNSIYSGVRSLSSARQPCEIIILIAVLSLSLLLLLFEYTRRTHKEEKY